MAEKQEVHGDQRSRLTFGSTKRRGFGRREKQERGRRGSIVGKEQVEKSWERRYSGAETGR